MPLPPPLTHTNCANQNIRVSTYTLAHPHTNCTHMLTNTCQCAQTQTAYTCCANIQECTHTPTPSKIHTHMHTLTYNTHHTVGSCLWKTKSCAPLPPSPHLAQLPHLPGALTDVAVSSSVAAASPVPASVSRVCRAVSRLQSNNESCHTQRFLMFVLKFKKQSPNFSVSHTQNKSHTSEQLPAK